MTTGCTGVRYARSQESLRPFVVGLPVCQSGVRIAGLVSCGGTGGNGEYRVVEVPYKLGLGS